jgi:hypothetical protein
MNGVNFEIEIGPELKFAGDGEKFSFDRQE